MKHGKIAWGLFFIISAALIILNQTGIFLDVNLVSLIITLLLVPVMVVSTKHRHFAGLFFSLAIVAIMFAEPLDIEKFTPWPVLGAALFLTIGMSLILPPKMFTHVHRFDFEKEFDSEQVTDENGEVINIEASFTGSTKYISSKNLKRVNIGANFSGVKVYFDDADIAGKEAVINVISEFSGVDIYVPKHWNCIDQISCSMGDVTQKGARVITGDEKCLILTGKSSFSGITIRYV